MVGNFEIKPKVIKVNGLVFTVQGYTEKPDGIRLAAATVLNIFGRLIAVKDPYTQIMLMDLLIGKAKDSNGKRYYKKRRRAH
jgi:hypothetical protein